MSEAIQSTTDDVVRIGDRYYVRVSAALTDENDRVLKHDESFALFDRHGDIRPLGLAEEGVYHNGTRHLSRFVLRVGGERPLFLGSTARSDNSRLAVDLANPDLVGADGREVPRNTVHIARSKVLLAGVCYEHLVVRNFGEERVRIPMTLRFAGDFADIFQVRGTPRTLQGTADRPEVVDGCVRLGYTGADGVRRETLLTFDPPPARLAPDEAAWELELDADEAVTVDIGIACETDGQAPHRLGYEAALSRASAHVRRVLGEVPVLTASNERLQDLIDRSFSDVAMMTTATPTGPFPYAGVPWFSTPFGRDALITALQTAWLVPDLAVGVLRLLAATQAQEDDPERDAQPGKIVHEIRRGEMAATGEIPFARYYGSHDATPLFVMLLHETWRRTGDLGLVRELWPNVERALHWMATDADPDGDGFAEYQRATENGLRHQGWKDSNDSISHADGRLAAGPIALVEVQAYIYAARQGAARMAAALGDEEAAGRLAADADALRERFEAAFWDDELGTYVLALDGDKNPCRVIASNAGHALYTGIARPDRAERVVATLMADRSFSGWGVRTLAAGERRYNPMSYHNGSVWPHDTAIVAAGFARYDFQEPAVRLLRSMFEASLEFDLLRLPELFCGFHRRAGEGPTRYPVACSPQAWAAGSIFMLLQACIGLELDAIDRRVVIGRGRLPDDIQRLRLAGLRVADAEVDLDILNQGDSVGVNVLRRSAPIDVVVVK